MAVSLVKTLVFAPTEQAKNNAFFLIYLSLEANRWHCKNSTLKNITACMEYYRCLGYEKTNSHS